MTTGYNGWANRQTWNVALWLDNEESYYRQAVEFAQRKARRDGRLGATSAEHFVKGILGWDRTPDGDGLSRVRWGQIAACIREMGGE